MNPFDHYNLPEKFAVGVSAPIFGIITTVPGDVNPWLQTIALVAGIFVSLLSAISIIKKNLK